MRMLRESDLRWTFIWLAGLALLWIWNTAFLNTRAFGLLNTAAMYTLVVAVSVVVLSVVLGWLSALALYRLNASGFRAGYLALTFVFNLVRSVPQIIGVLIGYILLTVLIYQGVLRSEYLQLMWMALVISLFVFLEVTDLIGERISYYRNLDFFDAMLCCGISETRIINFEILWKNSRAHLLHKSIAVFGIAIFLLCSIDFIISVGLSTDVSLSNFPTTLGGLLAKMDSKQDILAIGTVFTNPSNIPSLFLEHLQGVSTAFLIVFTLMCMYNISNGFVRKHRL